MTEKEIVQALRCCQFGEPCDWCQVVSDQNCVNVMHKCAADLIERLTAENAALRKEIEWKDMVISLAQREQAKALDAADLIDRLTAENAKAEAERDAAIVDLKIFAGCSACRHCCDHRRDHQESLLLTCCDCTKKQNCKCGSCSLGRSNWEWHELPEAPEEGGKA